MKTIKLLVFALMLILAGSVQSQLSVNVHIGTPPVWGPAGYDDVRYYYLPDVEAYYDVQTSMFIYLSGNRWIRRSYLAARYRNYDLYHGYKVVMRDYHGNSPYSDFREHRMRYARGYRGDEQRNVGERNDMQQRSRVINRPENNRNNGSDEHRNTKAQVHGDNNNQRGNDKGNKEGHDNENRK